jgi:hypothetical protein
MIHTVHLSEDLVDLLVTFANAYEQKNDQGQKETIMFSSTMGGTRVQHFGFEPNASFRVNIGDLQELDQLGLIDMSYGGTAHAGNFRVTSAGYHAVEQIKEQNEAIASAAVVPTEGPGMGMDWETQTFPILKAVYDLWSKNPTGKGVSQQQINAELRRAGDDALTSVVLRKLEEADFVTGKIHTDQIEGPLLCEPTTKAFEFLAGWPSARADAALARLVASLEAKIEATEDPEEKGKLKRLLAGVQEVGQSVMVNVFTNVITGAI